MSETDNILPYAYIFRLCEVEQSGQSTLVVNRGKGEFFVAFSRDSKVNIEINLELLSEEPKLLPDRWYVARRFVQMSLRATNVLSPSGYSVQFHSFDKPNNELFSSNVQSSFNRWWDDLIPTWKETITECFSKVNPHVWRMHSAFLAKQRRLYPRIYGGADSELEIPDNDLPEGLEEYWRSHDMLD